MEAIKHLKLNKHYLIQKSYGSAPIEVSVKNITRNCVLLREYTANGVKPYYDEWVSKDKILYDIVEELTEEALRKIKKLRDKKLTTKYK